MAPFSKLFEAFKSSLFEKYSKDAGKMLLHTATVGWVFSAAGQVLGIVRNDEISKEKKEFLIPQEMLDAAINIMSFYTITLFAQNFTKKFASSGKIISKEIAEGCKALNINFGKFFSNNIGTDIEKNISKIKAILASPADGVKISAEKTQELQSKLAAYEKLQNKYEPFAGGLKIIGNVIGAIISTNFVTPMIRNPLAAKRQKENIMQEKLRKYESGEVVFQPTAYGLPMQNKPVAVERKMPIFNQTSGSMKI